MAEKTPGALKAKHWAEPEIVIGGVKLGPGQVMAARVAIQLYLLQLEDETFCKGIGPVGDKYRARLREVCALMDGSIRKQEA